MLKEFRQFIMRGNVVDLAVAVIVGAAFGKIVTSFVADIIMPPLGMAMGHVNFTDLAVKLSDGKDGKPVLLKYGNFLQAVFDFTLVAMAIFAMVKAMNTLQNLRKKEEPAPPPPPRTKVCPECAMDIPVTARKCGHCTSVLA
ncbi:MAG: large-conductance mechanosensitive channel protein MscL [Planctomycetes bacterium]|nr:large-conductance mechanosensitive channel protein MscL [Planctomycetota bacterium]